MVTDEINLWCSVLIIQALMVVREYDIFTFRFRICKHKKVMNTGASSHAGLGANALTKISDNRHPEVRASFMVL